jgi:hypothetical protein
MEIPYSKYSEWLIPALVKIKLKLCIDFLCWSCRAFHRECDCIWAYSYYLDPKCCMYDTTVMAYIVCNMSIFDCGWLCFVPKFI